MAQERDRMFAESPTRRAISHRVFSHHGSQIIYRLVQQPRFFGSALQGWQILVYPSVHSDLMLSVLEDCRDHFRMQDRAHCRNKESRRNLVLIQKAEYAWQSGLRAKISRGKDIR